MDGTIRVMIHNDTTVQLPPKKINEEVQSVAMSNLKILGYALIASLGMFCNGIFVGWSSQTSSMLPESFSARQRAWVTSSLALGAAIGPFIAYKIWKLIGLKTCILIATIMMVLSAPMFAVSQCYWSLFGGRLIGGIALGIIHLFVPIYIQDISSAENRKTYLCVSQTMFAAGILVMYITGMFGSFLVGSIVSASVPLVFLVAFYFMPESPRYLCAKDKLMNAREILTRFKEVDMSVENSIRIWNNHDDDDDGKGNGLAIIFNKTLSARLLITVFGLAIFEQLIGAIALFFYMHKVLILTGGYYSPDLTAIFCLCAFMLAIIFPNFYGQQYKPKSVLLWSIALMSIALLALGIYCHYMATFGKFADSEITDLPLYLIGAFYLFFALGPFRLFWFFIEKSLPEEYYLTVRCYLISISWLLICGITRILPELIDFVGVGWVFWFMAIMCWMTGAFVAVLVPKFKMMPDENQKRFSNSESTSEMDA